MFNLVLVLALLMSALAPAARAADNLSGHILITGSSTMAPLVTAIAARYHTRHPLVTIDVLTGGSGRGLSDARQGKANIGMVSRALNANEKDLYGLPIARDGVALILHKDNPVRTLSDRQIIDIYTGKISNWKQVGGRDAPIVTVKSEAGRSSSELFSHYFGLSYDQIQSQRVVGDNRARIALLLEQPNAIVYMSVGESERSAAASVPIRPLPINGIEASSKNIRNGNFPIARALTLVTRSVPSDIVKSFIEYASSSEVTDLVVDHDFVPYFD